MSLRDSLPAPWLVAATLLAGLTAGVLAGRSGPSAPEPAADPPAPLPAPGRAPSFPGIPGAPPPEIAREMESAIAEAFGGDPADPMQVRIREAAAARLRTLVAKWAEGSKRHPLAAAAWWKAALGRAVPRVEDAPEGISRREVRFLDTTLPLVLSVPPRPAGSAGPVPLVLAVIEEPPDAAGTIRSLYGALLGTHAVAAVVLREPVEQDPRLVLLGLAEAAKAVPVDRDRVVLDGTGRGAKVAAELAPDAARQLAGVVLRSAENPGEPSVNLGLLGVLDLAKGGTAAPGAVQGWIRALPPRGIADPTRPVSWSTGTGGRYRSWGHWFVVKRTREPGTARPARVSISRDRERNAVVLRTENVAEIQLLLDDEGLDLDRPVKVVHDGMVVEERTVERSLDLVRAWASQGEPTLFVTAEITVRIPE